MKDVAARAGVGIKTVSRVVNGEGYVSTATAEKVQRAMAELHFRPDLAAGNLRRADGRSRSIALLLANVANPFDAAVHRAVEDIAHERNVVVLSASLDESAEREEPLVASFSTRRVDGLILMSARQSHAYLDADVRAGMPVVFVDRPPIELEADAVVADNAEGSRRAVEHLASFGHRRIAYFGDRAGLWTARERHRGYEAGLAAAGLQADVRGADDLTDEVMAEASVRAVLSSAEPPTAIFSAQNLVTIGAIRALRSLGLEHQVALVGFDDVVLGDLLDPPVTVVAQDPARIGRAAAELTFGRIDGRDGPARQVVVPTSLLVRGSGEIRPPT